MLYEYSTFLRFLNVQQAKLISKSIVLLILFSYVDRGNHYSLSLEHTESPLHCS